MLSIKNLCVSVREVDVLRGMNLDVGKGSIHAIMGPNGSGKSTLTQTLAGHNNYHIKSGKILYRDKALKDLSVSERACEGIFVAFQYPVEIVGLNNAYFLRSAYNAIQKYHSQKEVDAVQFLQTLKERLKFLGMDEKLIYRALNEGFSGGEKKKNEVLQLLSLQPRLAILDEIDSGVDIDALKFIADGINHFHSKDNSIILVTHYQRILHYIVPDYVHILVDGQIVETGDKNLAVKIEKHGYAEYR